MSHIACVATVKSSPLCSVLKFSPLAPDHPSSGSGPSPAQFPAELLLTDYRGEVGGGSKILFVKTL